MMATSPTPKTRRIIKRVIIKGDLILDTPTCLGNGDAEGLTDMALLRDSISERALLTGASIAGALRNYLRDYQHGYGADESAGDWATLLFGGVRGDERGEQSALIVGDALSNKPPAIELRDGVRIDGATRTAAAGAKYDLELLAAGTTFPLYFELLVTETDDEQSLRAALATALRALEHGDISIGMKKRRGFGRCRVANWQVWDFDLRRPEDLRAWLTFERSAPYTQPEPRRDLAALEAGQSDSKRDKRERLTIQASFRPMGTLLIRAGQDASGPAPDVVHLHSWRGRDGAMVPVVAGTSLAGVLRHRAERILKTLDRDISLVEGIFGNVPHGAANSKAAHASRLLVQESVVEQPAPDLVQTRVAIDRFTGGTLPGALFEEQVLVGAEETRAALNLELQRPRDAEIGLLLLLLKDLWTGDLPVGGESSIGRGRLQGIEATITLRRAERQDGNRDDGNMLETTWHIAQEQGGLNVSNAQTLQEFVSALLAYGEEKQ